MTAATTALELRLTAFAAATPDTELAGLLRWACLHIREQSEALTEAQTEAEDEMNARIRIETATHSAAMKLKEALEADVPGIFRQINRQEELEAQRDELLAVLKHIRRCIPYGGFVQIHDNSMTLAQIDAAIAKAEGGAA